VTDIKAFGIEKEELLRRAAEAEIISEHHLGQTIVREAEERGLTLMNEPTDFQVEKGHGIYATVGEQKMVIGNRKLLNENRINIDQLENDYAIQQEKDGNTAIFVSVN